MAVAFDAVGPSATGQTSTSSTTVTWTHTAGASATAVIVGCSLDTGGSDAGFTLTATYGGVTMTPLGLVHSNGQTAGFCRMFGLTGISSGAATVLVTASGGTPTQLSGGSMSFTGGAGFGTAVTNQGSGTGTITTLTVTVPSTTSGNQVAVIMVAGTTFSTVTSPGVKAYFGGGTASGAGGCAAGGYNASTGSSVGTTMTLTGADWMGAVAAEVQATGGVSANAAVAAAAGAALAATTATSNLTSGPRYATAASDLGGVYGSWNTPQYAEGGP